MLIDELKESNNIKLLTWRRKANPSRALGKLIFFSFCWFLVTLEYVFDWLI
jgi:hypothetical protein